MFLKNWSHANLFVRPPMTRRHGDALPEIPPPHVEPDAGVAGEPSRRPCEGGCRRSPTPRAYGQTSRGPARSPEMLGSRARRSGPSVRLATAAGREGNFSSQRTLENKRNGIEFQSASVRRTPMQQRRQSHRTEGAATPRPSFAGNRQEAKFSYPQPLGKARNGEGISPAVAGVQGNAASDSSGFIPENRNCVTTK
jgi:hypothetical protein